MENKRKALVPQYKTRILKEWEAELSKTNLPVECIYLPISLDDSISDVFNRCCDLIEEHGIDIMVSSCDTTLQVHAAIKERYPHIKGPSFESAFICNHKRFTRDVVVSQTENANVRYGYWIKSENATYGLGSIPENIKLILKPFSGHSSVAIQVVQNRAEAMKILDEEAKIKKSHVFMIPIAEFVQDTGKQWPYTLEHGVMIEEFIEHNSTENGKVTFLNVDCAYTQKKFIPWAITDKVYWPNKQQSFCGLGYPSHLPEEIQNNCWDLMEQLANILNKYGYDDQIVGTELIVYGDNIKVMEINGRMTSQMVQVYRKVFDDGDMVKACIEMGMGQVPKKPVLKDDRYCFSAYLPTHGKGLTGEMIDYELAENYPEIQMNYEKDHFLNAELSSISMGSVTVLGNSCTDCFNQVVSIVKKVAKSKLASPWLEQQYNETTEVLF